MMSVATPSVTKRNAEEGEARNHRDEALLAAGAQIAKRY